MKILVLTNLYPPHYDGGYELICETVVKTLRARGHSVNVITSTHGVAEGSSQSETGITRDLKIHGLVGYPWLGIQQLAKQEKHNNAILQKALDQHRPDLVYVWNMSGLSKSMLFTLQNTDIPRVFAVYDHWIFRASKADVWLRWWNDNDGRLRKKLLRLCWSVSGYRHRLHKAAPTTTTSRLRFPRIHFCSSSLRNSTAAAGYNVSGGMVIYSPVNTDRFNNKPKPAAVPTRRLLYVGRLNEDKGVMTALRAMALLRDKFPGSLSIYGRGEMNFETALKTYIQKEQLPVTLCSPLLPEQMPSVYAAHDALLFTSEWPEPFALTPLEAMASGLPVIGTTTGGSSELFRDGQNALTFTAGDPAELAERVLKLELNPVMRECIANKGREEVRARFPEPVIIDQIEDYLRETVACWPAQNRKGTAK